MVFPKLQLSERALRGLLRSKDFCNIIRYYLRSLFSCIASEHRQHRTESAAYFKPIFRFQKVDADHDIGKPQRTLDKC